ncbi:MAG: UDP-glucose 6-dehydrogenase [Thermotoga petrophila]|jgi:UDPglucose 6-dehydrogenase|uniref:UDP-glucose 6-dehydrogenase n=1 Tax=Thermotoga petrophila TaxID=93929 RepID=A0A117L2I1_9THEM|nr:MAG: UDP-glucose 6-dehydrogenase [Thermotoga petrophila]
MKKKITVVGAGYVGLSLAILLSQHNEVTILEINPQKVDLINKRISPIKDPDIEEYLRTKSLNLKATMDKEEAYSEADYVIIATPTDFDPSKNSFDTTSVEQVIKETLRYNRKALIIIKSTVPIGFTERMKQHFRTDNIVFSPEFLREGKALHDNLYPSRIVIGERSERAREVANLFLQGARKKDVPILLTGSTEAEAIKLFSNAYLAMRVAFFNELDTFAELKGLNTKEIIEGVCLDPRIGNFYNNPSFGYGGYCLPKDSKQLASHFNGIPHILISAIVESNETRKKHIADMIAKKNPGTIGIYRLTMKKDSDNFRNSSILDVIDYIRNRSNARIVIYEPLIKENIFKGMSVVNDLDEFKKMSDIILANRMSHELEDVIEKVYTRDLFNRD